MKLRALTSCCIAAAFACCSCDRSRPRQDPVQRLVQGAILSVGADRLIVRPPRNSALSAADQVIRLDPRNTGVNVQQSFFDAITGKMQSRSLVGGLSDLHVGDVALASTRNGTAVSIRVMEPAPVRGDLLRVGNGSLAITPLAGRDAAPERPEIVFEAGGATIVAQVETSDRYEPRQLSDLKPGDFVQVLAQGGKARIIGLVARPPVQGKLIELAGTSITIKPTTRPGEPEQIERSFAIDPAQTRFFHFYLGLPADPAAFSELAVGQSVEISAKDGMAQQVRIVYSPIHRTLVSVGENYIIVNRNPDMPNERFELTASTHVVLPKVVQRSRSPRGGMTYSYVYAEGYHPSDLRAGDKLSLTVRNGVVAEIRVTPRPEQLAQSN